MAYLQPGVKATPPEKGSFPLDHDAVCQMQAKEYLKCMKGHDNMYYKCRDLSKKYLECRMETNLMQTEDLNNYGFGIDNSGRDIAQKHNNVVKESKGFVAGLTVKAIDKTRNQES